MTNTPLKRASRRTLDREGHDLSHITYTQSGTDSYGDPTYTSGNTTVTGRFQTVSQPLFVRDATGEEVELDAEIQVKDSVTVTDVDGSRADRFIYDGTKYKVLNATDQDNGLITCRVRKI